ncbi:MAG: hypothetical protein EOQ45_32935 [Mesorhizobium sp.]|nr:MAG: hypothetical protein EOQ45_32935 [Mesorhizobium sp.]
MDPKEPDRSRASRVGWPVQWPLCRYRHNLHYAVSRIMPHDRVRRLLRLHSAMRQFGIIEPSGNGDVWVASALTYRTLRVPQKVPRRAARARSTPVRMFARNRR